MLVVGRLCGRKFSAEQSAFRESLAELGASDADVKRPVERIETELSLGC